MACGCQGTGAAPAKRQTYTVDLTGTGKQFTGAGDSLKRTYTTAAEANVVIAQLQLTGKVRPVVGVA